MLQWGVEEENRAQEAANTGKKRPQKGGSSMNGESISSVSQLSAMMNGK